MAERFSPGRALFWASTWGVGVAIGVALGGWLTVVGGAGTPGAESLDLVEDMVVLPGVAGVLVMIVHLIGQGLLAVVRGRRVPGDSHDSDQNPKHAEDEGV